MHPLEGEGVSVFTDTPSVALRASRRRAALRAQRLERDDGGTDAVQRLGQYFGSAHVRDAQMARSRRRRTSATIRSTGSWVPRSASSPASWTNAAVHALEVITNRVSVSARRRGTTPNPSRHPVIAYAFEKPSHRMTRARIPESAATERCGSSYEMRA